MMTTELIGNPEPAQDQETVSRRLDEKLRSVLGRLEEVRSRATEQARCITNATDAYAREKPWVVLGIAATAGFLVGILISRR